MPDVTLDAWRRFVELGGAIVGLAILARLANRWGLSTVPLYLLAGLAFGNGGLAPLSFSRAFVQSGADIGVLLLLFMLGLEYTGEQLKQNLRSGLAAGLADLILNFPPGLFAGLLLGWKPLPSVLLGGATYISSSGIVAKVLADLGRLANPETAIVVSVLVLEDLAMAVYLPVAGVLLAGGAAATLLLSVVVAIAVVSLVLFVAVRFGQKLSRLAAHESDEIILLTVLGTVLLVAGIAQRFQVSSAIGAFLVGIAASAVMLVLPYYLHDYQAFGRITILGEFLAVSAVVMCVTFIFVDLGQPGRVMNVLIYPSPTSVLFWDMVVLNGYLLINIVTGWTVLGCQKRGIPPPAWVKPLIILSIPWAISIHTVTAFIYAGLPGRDFWLTAIMAPRFLASAFASGPALLILFCLILKRFARFDAGEKAIQTLAQIVAYALATSIFFVLVELFTVFYSRIPGHMQHLTYLFKGLEGHTTIARWMAVSTFTAMAALVLLLIPRMRRREPLLALACCGAFLSLWIEKGLGLVVTGFVPSPLEMITDYTPTGPEVAITGGIWALGLLMVTLFTKVFVSVRNEE